MIHMSNQPKDRDALMRGMTLIELILVLLILAMLAGLLISSADTMMDRARVDETERRGQAVSQAICSDGSSCGRFLADLGRPPLLVRTDKGKQLSELWAPDERFAGAYGRSAAIVDWGEEIQGVNPQTEFALDCGWRGPYLQPGNDVFYDGWPEGGWSLFLSGIGWVDPDADGNMPSGCEGGMILKIRSLGADRAEGGADWIDIDREYPAHGDFLSATADLLVTVFYKPQAENGYRPVDENESDSPNQLRLALLLPAGNQACYVRLRWSDSEWDFWKDNPRLSPEIKGLLAAARISFSQVKLRGIIPGPRLIYAYGYRREGANAMAFYGRPIAVHLRPGDNEVASYLRRQD